MKNFTCGLLSAFISMPMALSKSQELTFWHTMNNEEAKTLKSVVGEFEKKNPDIKIKMQTVPFSDAQTKYKIAANSGDAPDVFRAEIAWVPEFAALGVLEEISSRVSKEDLADYMSAPLAYGQYDGKLWGIPQVTDCLALLYNKKLFKSKSLKAPETMDDLVKTALALTDAKTKTYGLGFNPASYWVQPFMWAFDGDLINGETREVLIESKESKAGFQFILDLIYKHKVTPDKLDFVNGYNNMMTGFKSGKYAMILNGPWATSDILEGQEFKGKDNLGVTLIPKGPKGTYGSPVGGHTYVMYTGSKKKDAAYTFMSFINQAKYQALFATKHSLLPTRNSAYELNEVKNNPIISSFRTNKLSVIPEGNIAFDKTVQDVLSQNKTPEQGLKKLGRAWSKLLKDENKKASQPKK